MDDCPELELLLARVMVGKATGEERLSGRWAELRGDERKTTKREGRMREGMK